MEGCGGGRGWLRGMPFVSRGSEERAKIGVVFVEDVCDQWVFVKTNQSASDHKSSAAEWAAEAGTPGVQRTSLSRAAVSLDPPLPVIGVRSRTAIP
jgi:hypothetical protein